VDSETAIVRAREIASNVILPLAAANDREGRFSIDAVRALGESGILGLLLPATVGGSQLGPEDFAQVTAILAEADPSVAMVFVMHVLAAAAIAVAPDRTRLRPVSRRSRAADISRRSPSARSAPGATSGLRFRGPSETVQGSGSPHGSRG
jgi:alkylation response protein AidB-like acyl-CoA dehydrogenase